MLRLIIQNRFHLLLKYFNIRNSLSDVPSAPLFVAAVSIFVACAAGFQVGGLAPEDFSVSNLPLRELTIVHLHDDVTRAMHYGCSGKDRESLKKMAATDAKTHEKKDIQAHSKSENFKKKIVLTEDNVPGASFKNKDAQIFHMNNLNVG